MSAARWSSIVYVAFAAAAGAATPPANHRNFVSCPIVRDTPTVPCWLAEYKGELYYLGIQTDVSAAFHPPLLGHKVLVEGVVKANAPRICGGIVLEPLKISPMSELDGTCNTILPAEDQYTVPFAPRPPGPSGGRLAFDAAPGTPRAEPAPLTGPQEFPIYYDFDMPVGGRHAATLSRIYEYASAQKQPKLEITCQRGSVLLSDGTSLTERDDMPSLRAKELAKLLHGAGIANEAMHVNARAQLALARGDSDWQERRCTVHIEP